MKQKKEKMEGFLGYSACILLSIIYMKYLDGTVGVLLLAFLLLIPFASIVYYIFSFGKSRLYLETEQHVVEGKSLQFVAKWENKSKLPTPFLQASICLDQHFENQELTCSLYAIWNQKTGVQECTTKAMIPGRACFRANNIQFSFLGDFWDFWVKYIRRTSSDESQYVKILPIIPEMTANGKLFQSVVNHLLSTETDEDEESNSSYSMSVMAGYDHRPYQPGDSLKRINWKLSSKKQELMVRKDETTSIAHTTILMDFSESTLGKDIEKLQQEALLLRACLGFSKLCATQGLPANLCYYAGKWRLRSLEHPDQVENERISMLDVGFQTNHQERFPDAHFLDGSVILLFSCNPDKQLIEFAKNRSDVQLLLPKDVPMGDIGISVWDISEDYTLTERFK